MSAAKIGFGVAAGYLLGRTKKLRFAITVGSMLAGQKVATNPAALIKQATEIIEKNPELAKLQQRVTGELFNAARNAAISQASSRIESANRALTARGSNEDEGDEEYDDEPEDEYEDDDTEGEESEDEYEEPGEEEDADEAEEGEDDEEPEDELDESEDDEPDAEDDEEEPEPSPRRRGLPGSVRSRSGAARRGFGSGEEDRGQEVGSGEEDRGQEVGSGEEDRGQEVGSGEEDRRRRSRLRRRRPPPRSRLRRRRPPPRSRPRRRRPPPRSRPPAAARGPRSGRGADPMASSDNADGQAQERRVGALQEPRRPRA